MSHGKSPAPIVSFPWDGHMDPMEWAQTRGFGELADRLGIEAVEFTTEGCVARMPVEGNTQGIGLMHGGAYVVLGETLGSMHANLLAPEGKVAVGVDINATHSGSAVEGYVRGECRLIHGGRKLTVHEITVRRETDGKLCSTVRITNMYTSKG